MGYINEKAVHTITLIRVIGLDSIGILRRSQSLPEAVQTITLINRDSLRSENSQRDIAIYRGFLRNSFIFQILIPDPPPLTLEGSVATLVNILI